MKKTSILIINLLLILSVLAKKDSDKVTSLPLCAPLPTNWFSGYLNASDTKLLHYIYIES